MPRPVKYDIYRFRFRIQWSTATAPPAREAPLTLPPHERVLSDDLIELCSS